MKPPHLSLAPWLAANPARILQALVVWQLSAWVLVPAFSYGMLPLDTLEAVAWGKEWQWGYYKHPPLGAWLAEIAVQLGGGRLEAVYLLAQLVLIGTLFYVWKIARLTLDPARAAMATALLAGSYFHSVLIPNFNMNTLQLPLWAGLAYHLLRILAGERRHWWAFAVLAALALLAKYSSALLLLTCALILVGTAEGRRALRCREFVFAALLGLLLLAPHLVWLVESDFLPIRYIADFRPEKEVSLAGHLLEPLRFAVGSLLSLLLCLPIPLLVFRRDGEFGKLDKDSLILLALFFGPMLLTMMYGAYSGSRLKSTWAFPFYSLAGVLLFRMLPTRADGAALLRYSLGLACTCLLVLGLHLAYKGGSDRSKTGFDGESLALSISEAWHSRYDTALPMVAADHVLAAIIAAYAPDRPAMLIDGDFVKSPWITPHDLRRGGVVVCADSPDCLHHVGDAGQATLSLEVDGKNFAVRFLAPTN